MGLDHLMQSGKSLFSCHPLDAFFPKLVRDQSEGKNTDGRAKCRREHIQPPSLMIARHEGDHQQIIAERKKEERGVQNPHQHGAQISEIQQKGEDGANEFKQAMFDPSSSVRVNRNWYRKEAAPASNRSGSVRVSAYSARSLRYQ